MTAKELLTFEITQVGHQIDVCLNGLPENGYDAKCGPNGMSPREVLEHLCDAYEAFIVHARGEKYAFGSYKVADQSIKGLNQAYREQRAKAVDAALAGDDERRLKDAYEYIVGHDNYHVGQLCLSRLQVDPGWDPYAIYS